MVNLLISAFACAISGMSPTSPLHEPVAITRSGQFTGEFAINEIMYAPAGGEPEWIELRNMRAEELDLRGYLISDASVTSKHLVAPGGLRVLPWEILTLTRDSMSLAPFRIGLPGRVVSVVGFPSLNNGGDGVYLYDNRGGVVDSVLYSPDWGGATGGRSLERVDAAALAQDQVNWGSCEDNDGATPGRENSISRKPFDIRPLFARAEVNADRSIDLVASAWNAGYRTAPDVLLSFHDDVNGDSFGSDDELLARTPFEKDIAPLDSQVVRWRWNSPAPGDHTIILATVFAADERRRNDTTSSFVRIAVPKGSLVINEIMFAPLVGEAEYVELVNGTDQFVNIAGWKITDRPGATGVANSMTVPSGRHLIAPGGTGVIAMDSSIFRFFPELLRSDTQNVIIPRTGQVSLNNDGDDVVIRDPSGNAVDSVAFSPAWHNPAISDRTGRALERILVRGRSNDPANWTTCGLPQGGTPGRTNSVALSPAPSEARLSSSPNPFSPDNDGIDEATVVHYVLPEGVWNVHVRIFDVRGRLIRRLATSVPGVGQGDVVWDGRDDQRVTARIGMYIVFVEALNEQGGESVIAKGVVVLAGRL